MKKIFILILLFFYFTEAKEDKELTIIYASSFPDITQTKFPNYSKLASLLKEVKDESENVIFLFGGNSLGSSALSSLDRGSHIIDILNSLEPDAMGINKKEFSFLEDELSLRSYEASFPFIASNITDPLTKDNLDGLNNSFIIQKADIKVGIISIINKDVIEEYALKRIKIKEIKKTVEDESKKLKQKGVDLIILLQGEYFKESEELLKEKIIDFAFAKDIHFDLTRNIDMFHKNNILIKDKKRVSIVKLQIENNQIKKIKKKLVSLEAFKKDKQILEQIVDYTSRLKLLLNEKIGILGTSLSTKRKDVRLQESKFANLLTDAIKIYVNADIALINAGTIRGDRKYEKNYTVSRGDIINELPYRNKVVLIKVTGEQILEALENGFSLVEKLKGRFPQVSGMEVKYNKNNPINKRVIEVLINNKKLEKTKIYKLATSNYLAKGGDGYSMFKNQKRVDFMSPKYRNISDVLIDYILKKNKVTPTIEGRIIDLSNEKK